MKRNLPIPAHSGDGNRSPSAICYRDDAQLLIVFEPNVSEHRHVVLRRNLYARSVAVVVSQLGSADNRGKDGCVGCDNAAGDGDVKRRPRHARFYSARCFAVFFRSRGTARSGGFLGIGGSSRLP
jgi:hypothetical protein